MKKLIVALFNKTAGDDTGVYWSDKVQYSKGTMLYFTTAMEKSLSGKYSYGKKLRSSQSYNFKIQLPTKDNKRQQNRLFLYGTSYFCCPKTCYKRCCFMER